MSNASWIETVSGSYGSGNGTLKYMVRANPGSSTRTGTISIGALTFTITQDGAPAASSFTRLAYNVVDASYDKTLDRMVLVAANPNELHIYDPVTLSDQLVPLKSPPLSVSVSPDGLHAAVGHDGWVSYVNLQTPGVEKVVQVITDVHSLILAGNGYAYLFPARDWSDIYSLQVVTEVWTATSAIYEGRVPRLRPGGNYMYVGGNWFSKWDISKGVAQLVTTSFNSVSTCGNLWFSESGTRFFTACGKVYRASDVPSEDLQYNGQLSGVNGLVWAAHSGIQQSAAVIPTSGYPQLGSDTQVQIYGDAYLGFAGTLTLPQFTVNGTPYAGHGKFAFWNSAQNKLFVIMKADDTANLASAFGVKVVAPSSASDGCSFTLAPTSVSEAPIGGFGSVTVTTGSSCVWTATSGASWLTISAGSFGFGTGSVAFSVAPNDSGSPRSATLTIGGKTFTVNQSVRSASVGVFRSGFFWLEDVDGNQQFNSPPDRAFAFGGVPGDIPITGDWNGSGTTKVGVYRPSNGLFVLDYDGDGQFTGAGSADYEYIPGLRLDSGSGPASCDGENRQPVRRYAHPPGLATYNESIEQVRCGAKARACSARSDASAPIGACAHAARDEWSQATACAVILAAYAEFPGYQYVCRTRQPR